MPRMIAAMLAVALVAAACGGTATPPSPPTAPPGLGTTLPPVPPRDFDAPHDPAELACGSERAEAPPQEQPSLASRHIGGTAELILPPATSRGVEIITFTGVAPDIGVDSRQTAGSLLGPVNKSLVVIVRNMESVPVREVSLNITASDEAGATYETGFVATTPSVLCPGQIGFARIDPDPLRSAPDDAPVLVDRMVTQLRPGVASDATEYPLDLDVLSHGRNGDRVDVELRNSNGELVRGARVTLICFRDDGVILSSGEAQIEGEILRGEIIETSVELEEPACVNYLVAAAGMNRPRA